MLVNIYNTYVISCDVIISFCTQNLIYDYTYIFIKGLKYCHIMFKCILIICTRWNGINKVLTVTKVFIKYSKNKT